MNNILEIFEEFGGYGAPNSVYVITKLVYGKQNTSKWCMVC